MVPALTGNYPHLQIEAPGLSKGLPEAKKVDAVLDLVGHRTLLNSIAIPHRHRRVCLAGRVDSIVGRGSTPLRDFRFANRPRHFTLPDERVSAHVRLFQ